MTSDRPVNDPKETAPFLPEVESLLYARGVLLRNVELLRRFQRECMEQNEKDKADSWSKIAWWIETRLLGTGGCVIAPFDDRYLDEGFRSMILNATSRPSS
jgi:hypothetical protein